MSDSPWEAQLTGLGEFIRAQRKLAKLSLRELSALSNVSNAYLSQLERGLHQPSVRVLTQLARAFGVPPETLLAQVGLAGEGGAGPAAPPGGGSPAGAAGPSAEEAIRSDPTLTEAQREALLAVYRSFSGG